MGAEQAKELLGKLNQQKADDPDPNNPNQQVPEEPTVEGLKAQLGEKEAENKRLTEENSSVIANTKAMQRNLSQRDAKTNQTDSRLDGIEDLIVGLAEQQAQLGMQRQELIGEPDFGIPQKPQQAPVNTVAETVAKMRDARKQEQEQTSKAQTVDEFKAQMWNRLKEAGVNPNDQNIIDTIGPMFTRSDFDSIREYINRTVILAEVGGTIEAKANELAEEKARKVLVGKGYVVNENPQGPSAPAGATLKRGDLRMITAEAKTPWDIINATKDKPWEIK